MEQNSHNIQMVMKTFELFKIFLRSLFIQASFTYKDKLSVGFAFCLIPGLKHISNNCEHFWQLLTHHSCYFNTHPYLASYIIGAVLSLEKRIEKSPAEEFPDIETVKVRLAGALGSLGDRLFWKYLKPLSSLVGLSIVFLFYNQFPWNWIGGILCFLILYNSVHLFYRWNGIVLGYKSGQNLIKSRTIVWIEKINFILACASLTVLGILIILEGKLIATHGHSGVIIFITAGLTAFFINYKKIFPFFGIIAGLLSAILLFGIFYWLGIEL